MEDVSNMSSRMFLKALLDESHFPLEIASGLKKSLLALYDNQEKRMENLKEMVERELTEEKAVLNIVTALAPQCYSRQMIDLNFFPFSFLFFRYFQSV